MFKGFGNDCKKAGYGILAGYAVLSIAYTSLTVIKNLIGLFF